MSSINIPKTLSGVRDHLGQLDKLATATEWSRAAIVAAFVELDQGHGGRETSSSGRLMSAREFAKLGFAGLQSPTTVAAYAKNWLDVLPRPVQGMAVNVPTAPWPPTRPDSAGSRVSSDPAKAVEQIIEKHGLSAIAEALPAALVDEHRRSHGDELRERVGGHIGGSHHGSRSHPSEPVDTTWMDIDATIGDLHHAIAKLATWNTTHRDAMGQRAERLGREHELLGMVVDGAKGVSDADLRALLEAEAS